MHGCEEEIVEVNQAADWLPDFFWTEDSATG
jgi:hypothetical protein